MKPYKPKLLNCYGQNMKKKITPLLVLEKNYMKMNPERNQGIIQKRKKAKRKIAL